MFLRERRAAGLKIQASARALVEISALVIVQGSLVRSKVIANLRESCKSNAQLSDRATLF